MNIKILLVSEDKEYIKRLGENLLSSHNPTGDKLEVSVFSDIDKLEEENFELNRFNVALTDESLFEIGKRLAQVSLIFTEDDSLDGDIKNDSIKENFTDKIFIYKYQRISGITNKISLSQSNLRKFKGIGSAGLLSIISIDGDSTFAANLVKTIVNNKITPLYTDFQHLNTTEFFFRDSMYNSKNLYDIFCSIAENENVLTTINTAVTTDGGVKFIKRFSDFSEVMQITAEEMERFIDSAKAAKEIDYLILNFGNNFCLGLNKALELSDEILIICEPSAVSLYKLNILFGEKSLINTFADKLTIVYNANSLENLPKFKCKDVLLAKDIDMVAKLLNARTNPSPL